jgi:ribosomal protein L30/L7E
VKLKLKDTRYSVDEGSEQGQGTGEAGRGSAAPAASAPAPWVERFLRPSYYELPMNQSTVRKRTHSYTPCINKVSLLLAWVMIAMTIHYFSCPTFHKKKKIKTKKVHFTKSEYSYNELLQKMTRSKSGIGVRNDRKPFREHVLGIVLRFQAL